MVAIFSGEEFENNLVRLMKKYGVEDIPAYKEKCLAYAQATGLSGLSDRLEAAKKAGRSAEAEIDSLADLLNVSGGSAADVSAPNSAPKLELPKTTEESIMSVQEGYLIGQSQPALGRR